MPEWSAVCALLVATTSCGRIGFSPTGSPDGASSDGSNADSSNADGSPCGTLHTVVDNFDDGVIDTADVYSQSFCSSGMAMTESGGQLVITFATGTGGDLRCGYATPMSYDLRDSRIFIELVQAPDPDAQVFFSVDAPNVNSLYMSKEGSSFLSIRKDTAGVEEYLVTPGYDPIQHRWWQIRENAGTTYWDTSSDGTSWIVRYSEATPFDVSVVRIAIFGRTFQAESSPGVARFDNLNGGAGPIACP